jgi:hypothetical protein
MDFSHLVPTAKTVHHDNSDANEKERARDEDDVGGEGEKSIPFWAENPVMKKSATKENGGGKETGKMRMKREVTVQNDLPSTIAPGRLKDKKSLVLCFDGTGVCFIGSIDNGGIC